MVQISKNIEDLEKELEKKIKDVQARLESLDALSDEYDTLVRELIKIQLERLKAEKSRIGAGNTISDKISSQARIVAIEKEIKDQLSKVASDKSSASNNSSLKDFEFTLIQVTEKFKDILDQISQISNLKFADLNQVLINSKRMSQREFIGETSADAAKKIAKVELESEEERREVIENQLELAEELRDQIKNIKEQLIESQTQFDSEINQAKLKLLQEKFETDKSKFSASISSELEKEFREAGKVRKVGRLGELNAKYDITGKIDTGTDRMISYLGRINPELGELADTIKSTITGFISFGANTIQFIQGLRGLFAGRSAIDKALHIQKMQELTASSLNTAAINTSTVSMKLHTKVLNGFRNIFARVGTALAAAGTFITGAFVGLATWISTKFMAVIKALRLAIIAFSGGLRMAFTGILFPVFTAIAGAVGAAVAAFAALSLPLKLLVGGVALAGAALLMFPDQIADIVKNAFEKFSQIVIDAGKYIAKKLEELASFFWTAARRILLKTGYDIGPYGNEPVAKRRSKSLYRLDEDNPNPATISPSGIMSSPGEFGKVIPMNELLSPDKIPDDSIAAMAHRSETGGKRGVIGNTDAGGNVGLHQMIPGTQAKFWNVLPEEMKKQLGTPGSAGFAQRFAQMEKTNPEFVRLQSEYMMKTHYLPEINALQKKGIDLSNRGKGVQSLLYSTATQEGAYARDTFSSALEGMDVSKMTDEEIVKTVSAYKRKNLNKRFRKYLSASPDGRRGLMNRINREEKEAIAMENQKLKTATTENQQLNQRVYGPQEAPVLPPPPGTQMQIDKDDNPSLQNVSAMPQMMYRNLCNTFIRCMDYDYGAGTTRLA